MTNSYPQGFSIIVCFYNAKDRLEPTIRHLAALVVPDGWEVEIILVDNCSTDGSTTFAEQLWSTLKVDSRVVLRAVFEPLPGLAYARKRGLAMASFSHVVYCDDDNWLKASYLEVLAEDIIGHPSVVGIGGIGNPVSSVALPNFFAWVGISFGTGAQQAHSGIKEGMAPWLYGAGMCLRHSSLKEAMRVFNVDLALGRTGGVLTGADDNEICYKLLFFNHQFYYDERLQFDHFMDPKRLNLEYYCRLMAGSAYSNAQLIALLMHYKKSFIGVFKRRIHWKTGYLRMLRYRWEAQKLQKHPELLTNEAIFKQFTNVYYAWHMLHASMNQQKSIRRNFLLLKPMVEKTGWKTLED